MSYSFNVTAKNKTEAKAAFVAEFEKVVALQPIHARDRDAATANAYAVIDLLDDAVPANHVVALHCNGYVSWVEVMKADFSNKLHSVSVSASASYVGA